MVYQHHSMRLFNVIHPSILKKYATFRGGDGTWTMVESDCGKQLCKILAERSWHDITEVVEQIISDYGLNEYGEVDYFGFSSDAFEDEYQAIQFRVDLLSEFEKDFQQYLRATCGDAVLYKIVTYNNIRRILNASSRIISFNYTSTIETALTSRISIIASLAGEHYDRVYIVGHALGVADYSVFDAINKDAEVICFYYSEDTKVEMETALKSLGFRYVMVQNAEIYR